MADIVRQTTDRGRLAVLLGGLVKGLALGPAGAAREVAIFLEAGLAADLVGLGDLGDKLEAVLRAEARLEDRVYSLWLLYISLFRPELRSMLWIGPALAGEDTEPCLRLGKGPSGPELGELAGELTILAGTFDPGLSAIPVQTSSGGIKFSLRRGMEAGTRPTNM